MGPKRVRSWRSDNESDDRTTLTALQMHHNAEYHETVANSSRDSPNHRNPQRHRQATAEQQQSTLLRHPAPHAQQLLGARERNFLQTYYIAFKGLDLKDDELPRAALRLLTHGASGTGRAMLYGCEGKVGLMPPGQLLRAIIASAGESMLWTAVAFGAVLRNPAYLSQAEPYAVCAMATLSACRRLPPDISPPLAVLHAHVMLSGLCLVLEQIPMAARVFAGALWTAGAIVSAEKTPEATPGEMHSESLAHAAMLALDENTWMVLESRRLFLAFAAACLDPVSAQRMPQAVRTSGADTVEHTRTDRPGQAPLRITWCHASQSRWRRFGEPCTSTHNSSVVHPPNCTSIVAPTPFLLNAMQIMAMVVSAPPGADLAPAALEAGAKLLRLRERVVASIGDDALSSGTAFCMACDLVFLRLLIGHEASHAGAFNCLLSA
ncbi:hypothetical protein JKP88DRAFT_245152 [Tribonema minus]|nr:hypothetical protein JKP88DRAFT_256063 [Tribonema minus]KAG5183457.1 hypothetical protein JKP88DRAFT_255816 [Tribonema minus]KAG5183511.1 hypothetical protein JKP88DRAFT_245152 [Tribonema minus]